uniref:UTRA domain-containing protein n=1 Tax=Eubacterium cellulosolvens TaxID=29322 RepID=UPI000483DD5E|nr:UTRA domain-containing protein [[Eubacterium] cellulosolvens]
MPKSKYDSIYNDLKLKIDSNVYEDGTYLPSENTLIKLYGCSRNTIRRAVSHLIIEGYVQPHHGKGVRIIHSSSPNRKYDFTMSGIQGFTDTVTKSGYEVKTKVIVFTDMEVNEQLEKKTGIPLGMPIYYIRRVRYLDGIAKMVDTNLIRKDIVPGLTKADAEKSLFFYFSNSAGLEIKTIKRKITVEHSTPFDEKYLELDDYNCLAVMTSKCYNEDGIQFEYTESRNRPDIFVFNSVLTNSLKPNQ